MVFGKAGHVSYSAYDRRGGTIAPHSLVKARLYYTQPSDVQIEDSDNTDPGDAIAVNSGDWINGAFTNEKLIPFGAIADPGPTQLEPYRKQAWLVISFRLQSAGEIVNDIQSIYISRVHGALSRYGVGVDEVEVVDRGFRDYSSEINIPKKIELAERLVTIDLEADMIALERIEQADAKELVLTKAIILTYSDLNNQPDDVWFKKKKEWEEVYKALRVKIKVAWDAANTLDKDPDDKAQFSVVYQER